MILKEIERAKKIGKKLMLQRLIDGASGNISFRDGEIFYITKTGVMLDELDETSFVKLSINSNDYNPIASSDQLVHREIYKNTDYNAVLHCHGVYGVTLSFKKTAIYPMDLEGRYFLGEIEVINAPFGKFDGAKLISKALKKNKVVLVRGHGIYACGKNIDEAYRLASYLEHSCEIIYRLSRKY